MRSIQRIQRVYRFVILYGCSPFEHRWVATFGISFTHPATEGIVNGLFKGLTLTILKGPLQAAIGFTVNDRMKAALREWESSGPQRVPEPVRTISKR